MTTEEKLLSEKLEKNLEKPSPEIGASGVELDLEGSQETSNLNPSSGSNNGGNGDSYEEKFLKNILYPNIYIAPLKLAILTPVWCLVPYIVAVSYGHLNPVFPYVSDLGALAPEAGHFTQICDMMALLVLFTGYFRFRQIRYSLSHLVPSSPFSRSKSPEVLTYYHNRNFISLLLSFALTFGLITLANYRTSEHVYLHSMGSLFLIFPLPAYFCYQIIIVRYLSEHEVESKPCSMLAWNIVGIVGWVGFAIFSNLSVPFVGIEKFYDADFRMNWNSEQPGYVLHVIGTVFEWIAINSLCPLSVCLFNRMRLFEHFDKA